MNMRADAVIGKTVTPRMARARPDPGGANRVVTRANHKLDAPIHPPLLAF